MPPNILRQNTERNKFAAALDEANFMQTLCSRAQNVKTSSELIPLKLTPGAELKTAAPIRVTRI